MDIELIRTLIKELNNDNMPNKAYNFYYDETNNYRKVKLLDFDLGFKDNRILTDNYTLGGICIEQEKVLDTYKLMTRLKLQKNQELKATIKKAQTEIAKQKDEKKKQELIKKYENDITYLKNTNDKKYAKKLEEIDKSISKTIQTEAKSAGYDLVLSKSVVLYGGNDITAEIAKVVK